MPKGPKGQKRPADVIGNAVKVMRIATGEEEDEFPADDGKDKAAQSLGRRGGKARAKALNPNVGPKLLGKPPRRDGKHRLSRPELLLTTAKPYSGRCWKRGASGQKMRAMRLTRAGSPLVRSSGATVPAGSPT